MATAQPMELHARPDVGPLDRVPDVERGATDIALERISPSLEGFRREVRTEPRDYGKERLQRDMEGAFQRHYADRAQRREREREGGVDTAGGGGVRDQGLGRRERDIERDKGMNAAANYIGDEGEQRGGEATAGQEFERGLAADRDMGRTEQLGANKVESGATARRPIGIANIIVAEIARGSPVPTPTRGSGYDAEAESYGSDDIAGGRDVRTGGRYEATPGRVSSAQ